MGVHRKLISFVTKLRWASSHSLMFNSTAMTMVTSPITPIKGVKIYAYSCANARPSC